LWWAASALVGSEARLPSPPRVLEEIRGILAEDFWNQFWASIVRVFAGFVAAIVIGTPLGFLMGRSRYWGNFLQAPVVVAGSIPGLTYAVLAFVIFGISFWGPVMAVGLISMPYVAINVAEGVHGVNKGLVDMSRAYGRSERQVFKHVVVPSVLPFIFAGVRLSFSLAWKVGTLTEVFGSSKGIGFQIRRNFQLFNMPAVIAWVLLFCLFMLLLERLVLVRMERRLFRWRQWEHDR
ncbi:MAG TPA: ABC transporter permease subunit, partial [Acidimicrobiia bacterium]|nr:ABC transporter permease subunit [Acidimicrobiia bacterium]